MGWGSRGQGEGDWWKVGRRVAEGPGGSYLVMGVWDAQESMEALVGGQKGPLRPHPKVPLASYPCEVASGSQDLSQGHLLQGQTPSGAGLQNSRVQAHPNWESASQERSPIGQVTESVRQRETKAETDTWRREERGGRQRNVNFSKDTEPLASPTGAQSESGRRCTGSPAPSLTGRVCIETWAHRSR